MSKIHYGIFDGIFHSKKINICESSLKSWDNNNYKILQALLSNFLFSPRLIIFIFIFVILNYILCILLKPMVILLM